MLNAMNSIKTERMKLAQGITILLSLAYITPACAADSPTDGNLIGSITQASTTLSFSRDAVKLYSLLSNNYNAIPVKIRLANADEPGVINLGPGQELDF